MLAFSLSCFGEKDTILFANWGKLSQSSFQMRMPWLLEVNILCVQAM